MNPKTISSGVSPIHAAAPAGAAPPVGAPLRRCSRCRVEKPAEEFEGRKQCHACREDARQRTRRSRAEDPERWRAYQQRQIAKDPERFTGNIRRWRSENHDRRREYDRHWREANRDRHLKNQRRWNTSEAGRARQHRRRARKRNATIGNIPRDAEHRLRRLQNGQCCYCDTDLAARGIHLEHVTPLAREGSHAWENVVLACPPCNLAKGDRLNDEWKPDVDWLAWCRRHPWISWRPKRRGGA